MPKLRLALTLSLCLLLATACQAPVLSTPTASPTPTAALTQPEELAPTATPASANTDTPVSANTGTPTPANTGTPLPASTATPAFPTFATDTPTWVPATLLPATIVSSIPITSGFSGCFTTLVPLALTSINPATGPVGTTFAIQGTGGYLQDSCGGYNEAPRFFLLYLDGAELGAFMCYFNRCEASVSLPATTQPGPHCFSLTPSGCEMPFEVTP